MRLIKPINNISHQYLIVAVNGIAVLLGVVVLNAIITRYFGIDKLGEFLLIKRTATALVSIFLLGLNISIPVLLNREDPEKIATISLILIFLFTIPSIILFIIISTNWIIPNYSIKILFGIFLYISGTSLQFFTYSHYRGNFNFITGSLVHFTGTALIPILCAYFVKDIYSLLSISGLLNIGVSTLLFIKIYFQKYRLAYSRNTLALVLKFGLERFPSFISQFIVLAAPSIFISTYGNWREVALINSNISLIRLFLFVVQPIGIILLPRASRIQSSIDKENLSAALNILLKLVIAFSILVTIFFYMNNSYIVSMWLNTNVDDSLIISALIVFVLPFYLITEILRSPIDALSNRGLNSAIYTLSALIFIIGFYTLNFLQDTPLIAVSISFVISFVASSSCMVFFLRRTINLKISLVNKEFILPVLMFSVFELVIYLMHYQPLINLILGILAGVFTSLLLIYFSMSQIKDVINTLNRL